jgi:hypothetical protein
MHPETCCLAYEELCQYLHTNPETFRRVWKDLPHFFAPGTEGSNLKAARFDLIEVVNHLKEVGRVGHKVQDQIGNTVSGGVRVSGGARSKSRVREKNGSANMDSDGKNPNGGGVKKKWRVERVAMGEGV